MSRSGDFRGDDDRQTDRQTNYFTPAHVRGVIIIMNSLQLTINSQWESGTSLILSCATVDYRLVQISNPSWDCEHIEEREPRIGRYCITTDNKWFWATSDVYNSSTTSVVLYAPRSTDLSHTITTNITENGGGIPCSFKVGKQCATGRLGEQDGSQTYNRDKNFNCWVKPLMLW